jgi:hypothetical protein
MTEGLFDRYFRLLAGQLPAAEYGVIASGTDEAANVPTAAAQLTGSPVAGCLC